MENASKNPHFSYKLFVFTEGLGDAIIPKKYRKNIVDYLHKANIKHVPYFGIGFYAYILFFLSMAADIFLLQTNYFSNVDIIFGIILSLFFIPIIFLCALTISLIFCKFYLDLKIAKKVRNMEEVFPEFLAELSLNLKAGQNFEEALENSLEKEFGCLKDEIEQICKKIRLGTEVETAVNEFTRSYNSSIIEEAFNLIVLSWKKGARTPTLIDRIVDNIEEIRFLRKKVVASVGSYRIFLSVVTLIIAPAMFAMSFYLIRLIRGIINKVIESGGNQTVFFKINAIRVNEIHFIWFAYIALVLISLFCAAIISTIKSGTLKEGFMYLIYYPVISLISFRIFIFLFSIFFSYFKI